MTPTTTATGPRLVPAGTGLVRQVGADLVRIKTSCRDTDDRFEVLEVVSAPGAGPPLHHHAPAETFYVVEGRFEFPRADGTTIQASPGDVVIIPSHAPHTVRNVGEAFGRLVAVFAPAGMERFVDAVGVPLPDDAVEPVPIAEAPEMTRVLAIAEAHGIHVVDGRSPGEPTEGGAG